MTIKTLTWKCGCYMAPVWYCPGRCDVPLVLCCSCENDCFRGN